MNHFTQQCHIESKIWNRALHWLISNDEHELHNKVNTNKMAFH